MENQQDKGFFGQPKGLSTLFFTEMWERFSYYGMRALLIYYMYDTVTNGGLGLPRASALAIMSIYGSLIYMSSIVGGWVSDRVLGETDSVFRWYLHHAWTHRSCFAIRSFYTVYFNGFDHYWYSLFETKCFGNGWTSLFENRLAS